MTRSPVVNWKNSSVQTLSKNTKFKENYYEKALKSAKLRRTLIISEKMIQ